MGDRAYAEIAVVQAWGHNESVVTAEGEKGNLIATVFVHVTGKKSEELICALCRTHPKP